MPTLRHLYVVFGGQLLGETQTEDWQCGIRGQASFTDLAGAQAWAAGTVKAGLQNWFSANANLMRNDASISFLKANWIKTDGTYDYASHPVTETLNGVRGGTPPSGPDFIDLCYSWVTSAVRGPASKGRIYPPNVPNTNSTLNGRTVVGLTDQTAHLAAAKALLTVLHTPSGGGTFSPGVVAQATPDQNLIIGVRIGNVMDVQRRRKNKLQEAYLGSNWP
uniref:Uncharacterized protein n=1 Tax=uncultured prokaryote TaxID=198431 RepID=A0A0H5Q3Y4_9ZZZZ|nr:hypothetical protein [uncultured prokaryote]